MQKSIKQQYIDLREGNMSQANFMRNLRMTLPQFVTNLSSFEDSVRILKNKGILNEMLDPTQAEEIALAAGSYEAAVDKLMDMGLTSQEADKIANELYPEEEEYNDDEYYDDLRADDYRMNQLDEAKDPSSEGKWKTVTGKDLYSQFQEIDNLNGQEVLIGIDYEMQKNQDLTKIAAAKIVVKNLKKNPIYYTSTLMSGVEGYKPEYIGGKSANPEAHQMQYLEKNMGNVVDKKRGMQPVKDIEKPKKDSDKGGETNKMEKGISLMSLIAKSTRGVQKMDATGEKMKKITIKEGQYDFIGHLKAGEEEELRSKIPDAHIEEDTEYGQKINTTISSETKSDEEIKSIVDKIIGMPGTKKDVPGTIFNKNAGIAAGLKSLTKDDLMEMIRKELDEITGAYGGDAMDPEDGSSYTNY